MSTYYDADDKKLFVFLKESNIQEHELNDLDTMNYFIDREGQKWGINPTIDSVGFSEHDNEDIEDDEESIRIYYISSLYTEIYPE